MTDRLYFIWYSLLCGVGSADGVRLLEHFDCDARAIFDADETALRSLKGFDNVFLSRFLKKSLEDAKNVTEFCFMNSIRAITCIDPEYPDRLRSLPNRPLVLYAKGHIDRLSKRLCVGVIGTRDMSEYGKHAAFDIVRGLCAHDAVVVSGAAYGVDSVANQTAVYFKADTIAVLGSGVNVPYPRENARMLDEIAERGLVLSEFAPGTPPNGRNFPIRNRIISGLSDALLVVEADVKSGALITADLAKRQNRALYAVPGSIYSAVSRGTNALLAGDAKPCMSADSILRDFRETFCVDLLEEFKNNKEYLRYEMRSQQRVDVDRPAKKSSGAKSDKSTVAKADKPSQTQTDVQPAAKSKESAPRRKVEPTSPKPTSAPKAKHVAESPKTPDPGILALLKPVDRQVLEALSASEALSPDKLVSDELSVSEVMSSLTILELYDAVERLPNGNFKRKI